MELRVLKYFLTVAREENITKAAETLHITQPTLSRQLTELEEELGTQLLIRGKRKLILTDAGILLRRRAEEISEMTERLEREIREADNNVSGKVSIGCGGVGSVDIVIKAIENFRIEFPSVSFEIYTNSAEYVKERINKGLLDFGILLEPVDIERFDYVRLPHKETVGLITSPLNPLSNKTYMTPCDFEEVPLIVPSRSAIKNELASWFGEHYHNLNIIGDSNLINNSALLVKDNVANILAIDGAAQLYDKEYIRFIPLYPEMKLGSVFVWKKHQPTGVAAAKFLDEIIMLIGHNLS